MDCLLVSLVRLDILQEMTGKQCYRVFCFRAYYRLFLAPLEKAKEACTQSGHKVEDHFKQILEMVEIGSGASRGVED